VENVQEELISNVDLVEEIHLHLHLPLHQLQVKMIHIMDHAVEVEVLALILM
jgi:hypothetical protein